MPMPRSTSCGRNRNLMRGRAASTPAMLCLLLTLLLQQAWLAAAQSTEITPIGWRGCNSDEQLTQCGNIPLTRRYRAHRRQCCVQYRPGRLPQPAVQLIKVASVQQASVADTIPRSDLTTDYLTKPNYFINGGAGCPTALTANTPTFSVGAGGYSNWATTSTTVPNLSKAVLQRVKKSIMTSSNMPTAVKNYYNSIRKVNIVNGVTWNHPGAGTGAAELAIMRYRLNISDPVKSAALNSLITGVGVKPKTYVTSAGTWSPPTNCPATGYYGPLPMANVQTRYGGVDAISGTCPSNYPSTAPQSQCGHESFVELDGQMSYKMALAYHATGDTRYSDQVFKIVTAWCTTNTQWGWQSENGPLEAGWGVAAMARALELLRHIAPAGLIPQFVKWVMGPPYTNNVIANMQYFIQLTNNQNRPNQFSNWHTTLGEAYMAVGVLSENITTYNRGVSLYNTVVAQYLRWGKDSFAAGPPTARVLGEATETLRDMYHTQFGMGGLSTMMAIAWDQDDASLYALNNHAVASMLETHARLTNAWLNSKSTAMLPQNFAYYDSTTFPKPPTGTTWRFDIDSQFWRAYRTIDGAYSGTQLTDGKKYLLGFGFLPTGWETAYNHYAGRLGIPMPETAALLAKSWPEWQEFHWGLGTLSHAQTAQALWRDGLTQANLCGTAVRAASTDTTVEAAGSSDLLATEATGATPTNDVTNSDGVANDGNTAGAAIADSTIP